MTDGDLPIAEFGFPGSLRDQLVAAVRVLPLGEVDLAHALGEGEGYTSVAEWRSGHEKFWHSAEMRQALDDPAFTVSDDTLVVAEEFRLVPGDRA